ncbi:MFS transporter [Thermogladius sp. KZ2Tp1]|uniref:MFS transporter n=1 Tax=Thermogladius sp. KZ2Tp1 TaxID=3136289 RepID=UPI003DA8B356
MKRAAVVLLVVMLFAYGLVYFHRVMTGIMKEEIEGFAEYYKVDPEYLLAFFPSAYFYAYALSQLFMGSLVDTYGVKRVGALMMGLMGLSTALMMLPSPAALMLGRTLVGVSAAVVFVGTQRVASLYFASSSQAIITSLLLMTGNISGLLATYPLRVFLSYYGLAGLFTILAALALTIMVLVYLLAWDVGTRKKGLGLREVWGKLVHLSREKHAWATALGAVASYGTGTAFQAAWGQDLMSRVFGYDKFTVSILLMYLALSFVLSAPLVGVLSDRVMGRRKPVLIASNIVSTLSWALIIASVLTHSSPLLLAGLVLLGVSMGLHIVAPPMAKEPYGIDYSATATSFFNLVLFTGIAVLQSTEPFVGPLANSALSLTVSLLGLVLVVAWTRETLRS